jgi:hypothetical protein
MKGFVPLCVWKNQSFNSIGRKELSMANPNTEKLSEIGTAFKQGVSQTAETAKQAALETSRSIVDQAQQTASSVYQKAGEALTAAEKKAESAVATTADQMHSVASTIREKVPSEGIPGRASRRVSDSLDSGARYLEKEGLTGIGRDLTDFVRRNPFPAVLAGVCAGYWLARVTHRQRAQ